MYTALSCRCTAITDGAFMRGAFGRCKKRWFQTIITGLGNPKNQYQYTKHNAGVLMADLLKKELAQRQSWVKYGKKSLAEYVVLQDKNVILCKNTGGYMNLSGETFLPIWKSLEREHRPSDGVTECVVIFDDLDTPFGKVKLRKPGTSTKGHNGLKDIANKLGHLNFYKLAIGIGRPAERDPQQVVNHVLSKFNNNELSILEQECLPETLRLLEPFLR
ncbi:hypothetical protein TPHA_0I00360 [Tetrapisispora phaffii CBS 4417]|uniref:Peptidyl-tRNA hydrolase n=1 Tax=Tetrapisispora phaffii (strain ATCC 24235 / CBS 4417 / NBRC 1672 / NRRL Y-8282 / UCD 70-5) TaxID=1071381 RepID=G8BXB5_TETPH|nr:hypothetical protein TPHA_0I00360 [Tetrapisispora phaffii CBS 4417]CCE64543.1 hypothetical protein TPHA_0I00360 [Tetrapisispora phaffii CBS 4417]